MSFGGARPSTACRARSVVGSGGGPPSLRIHPRSCPAGWLQIVAVVVVVDVRRKPGRPATGSAGSVGGLGIGAGIVDAACCYYCYCSVSPIGYVETAVAAEWVSRSYVLVVEAVEKDTAGNRVSHLWEGLGVKTKC